MHEFPSPDLWVPHRIAYGETDCMGVVYYAQYFFLFERARSEFIRNKGVSYAEVEKRGVLLPVREANCRYRSPARYDDLVYARIAINEVKRASLRFVYEIWNEEKNRLIAEGSTQHAVVDANGKPCAIPDWFGDIILK